MKTSTLKHKGYLGSIEHDLDEGILYGKVLHVTDLILFEGETLSDLKKNFDQAVDDYLATCVEQGIEPEKPFKGSFNIRIAPELHKQVAIAASQHGMSLNRFVAETLSQAVDQD